MQLEKHGLEAVDAVDEFASRFGAKQTFFHPRDAIDTFGLGF